MPQRPVQDHDWKALAGVFSPVPFREKIQCWIAWQVPRQPSPMPDETSSARRPEISGGGAMQTK
jgi:hypothetical protein